MFANLIITTRPTNASQAIRVEPDVTKRTDSICTYTRTQWAQVPAIPCNCSNFSASWPPVDPAIDLPCWLECDVTYPLAFGSAVESSFRNCSNLAITPLSFLTFYTLVNFTNASTLRAFMAFNDSIQEFSQGYYLDPGFNFTAGRFLGELITAWFNDRLHRERHGGNAHLLFNPAGDTGDLATSLCTRNGTFFNPYSGIIRRDAFNGDKLDPIYMPGMIDAANRLMLGGVSKGTLIPQMYGRDWCVYPEDPSTPGSGSVQTAGNKDASRFYHVWIEGGPIGSGFADFKWDLGNWSYGAEAMTYLLELYNSGFGSCAGGAPEIVNASKCFIVDRQARPRPPADTHVGEVHPTVNTTGGLPYFLDRACTWLPSEFALGPPSNPALCNCASFSSLVAQYFVNVSNASAVASITNLTTLGGCLVSCLEADLFPLIVGMRRDECRFTEFCGSYAYEWSTYENMLNGTGQAFTSALANSVNVRQWDFIDETADGFMDSASSFNATVIRNIEPLSSWTFEGRMRSELIAAKFNLYILKQMQPNITLFFRTLNDPLFASGPCLTNPAARQFFGGKRVEYVVDVAEKWFLGMFSSYYRRCSYVFDDGTPQRTLCEAFDLVYHHQALIADANFQADQILYQAWIFCGYVTD